MIVTSQKYVLSTGNIISIIKELAFKYELIKVKI